MPTVDANKLKWDGDYHWQNRGDEWSAAWGGPAMQWYGSILPRIHRLVPADNILEIACGYGRWTQFLKNCCKRLVALDLSEECVAACKGRFSDCSNIEYLVNDGRDLRAIPDASIDFVFSFDSLVHADRSVLDAYIAQFPRILAEGGVAFIHHSNLGEYQSMYKMVRRIPMLEGLLKYAGVLERNLHWRDPSVSAKVVAELARTHQLDCTAQEVLRWGTKRFEIDCFSTIKKGTSHQVDNNQFLRNSRFMKEVDGLFQLSRLYAPK